MANGQIQIDPITGERTGHEIDSQTGERITTRIRTIETGGRAESIRPISRLEILRRKLVSAEEAVPAIVGMGAGSLMSGGLAAIPVAGAGGALGETYKQIVSSLPDVLSPLKHVLLGGPLGSLTVAIETVQKLRGEKPEPMLRRPGLLPKLEEVKSAAIAGLIGEPLGRGAAGVVQKTLAPFASKVAPIVAEAKAVGIPLSPADILPTSGIIRGLQSRAEASVAGRPIMQHFYVDAAEKAAKVAQEIGDTIGPLDTEFMTGVKVKEAIEAGHLVFGQKTAKSYKLIDDLTGGSSPASLVKVKTEAARLLGMIQRISPSLRAGDSKLPGLLKSVAKLPNSLSFSELQILRSSFLADIRAKGRQIDRAIGAEKSLSKVIDEAMMDAAGKAGSGVPQLVRDANALYVRGKKSIDSKMIQGLASRNEEDIAKLIWQPNAVTEAAAVKNALTGEFSTPATRDTWNLLRRRGFESILENATKGEAAGVSLGIFRGKPMLASWEKLQPEIKKMLAGNQLPQIQRFMRVAKEANLEKAITLTKNQMGWFETGLSISAISAGLGLLAGQFYGPRTGGISAGVTALVLLASPKYTAKLMTSPTGIKWLTEGIRMSPISKEGIKLINKLAAYEALEPAGPTGAAKPNPPVNVGVSPRPEYKLAPIPGGQR